MIKGKFILAIIPARGGSKGIPRKNIRNLAGKPLIAWTIQEAKKSKYIDRLIVSTEDAEIADIASQWGAEVPFMRPGELATDTASGIDVILHAINEIPDAELVVQLQPTSPFRIIDDIDEAIEQWGIHGETVVSVTKSKKPPEWMFSMDKEQCLQPVVGSYSFPTNRQQIRKVYSLNGAVYVAGRDSIIKHKSFLVSTTHGYVMPAERSIDLDDEMDWKYSEWLFQLK